MENSIGFREGTSNMASKNMPCLQHCTPLSLKVYIAKYTQDNINPKHEQSCDFVDSRLFPTRE